MDTPEQIVRELAEKWPILQDASCRFCRVVVFWQIGDKMPDAAPGNHLGEGDGCVWARARRWVAENPASA